MAQSSSYTPKHISATLEQPSFFSGTLMPLLKTLATMAVTGYVMLVSDVMGVMYGSRKIYRNVLYLSFICHAVLTAIGFYLTVIVSRYEPNWENTHMKHIYVATGAMVSGSTLWMIAVWPVYHMWTIPIGLAIMFFVFSAVSLIPGGKKRKEE